MLVVVVPRSWLVVTPITVGVSPLATVTLAYIGHKSHIAIPNFLITLERNFPNLEVKIVLRYQNIRWQLLRY